MGSKSNLLFLVLTNFNYLNFNRFALYFIALYYLISLKVTIVFIPIYRTSYGGFYSITFALKQSLYVHFFDFTIRVTSNTYIVQKVDPVITIGDSSDCYRKAINNA